MIKVKYVSRKKLYPAFGYADIKKDVAYVRKDLPKLVKKFIKTHELFHLRHKKPRNWFWEEIKANAYSGIRHPLGLIVTIIMSLRIDRIRLYIDRFKKGY